MSFRPSLGWITDHWRLKLAAFGMALLLWAVVSAEQETAQWLPARVQVEERDAQYVLEGVPEPAEVRVRVTGPGRQLWSLAFDRPVVQLVIPYVGDRRSFAIDPSMVRLPSGSAGVRVLDVSPAVVRLRFQRLSTRDLPVRAQVGAQSGRRFVVDSLVILPAAVRVTGPASRLVGLDAVVTRAFEIVPDDDGSFGRVVELDTSDLDGLVLSAGEVRVEGRVDRRVERLFSAVPLPAPAGATATPAEVDVVVQGAERLVRGLAPTGVSVRVPADSVPAALPPDGVDLPLAVDGLPPGVTARTVPVRVRVLPAAAPPAPDSAAGGAP